MNGQPSDNQFSLPEAIRREIAFFDLFDYPLTLMEIRGEVSFAGPLFDLGRELDELVEGGRIAEQNGFYFLPGRQEIIGVRRRRFNYSQRKIGIARRFARIFSWLPGVRLVALANTIGFCNLRDGSDIDFFIIAASGRLWTSRLFCTGLAQLLGARPAAGNKRDKICLSFYLSEDALNLSALELPGGDPYFRHWRRHLFILYNDKKMFERLEKANSGEPFTPSPAKRPGISERAAKALQLWLMPRALRQSASENGGVVINDQVLKFYQQDRRREFLDLYGKKINDASH